MLVCQKQICYNWNTIKGKWNKNLRRLCLKMKEKSVFLKDHGITAKFEELETRDSKLWDELCKIAEEYDKQKPYLEATMQGFINSIGFSKHIHSIRYRLKDTDSLIVKIIEKKFENTDPDSKYNHVTADNYYQIITDLIGVRIIIRYRYEWQEIHKLIWEKFYKENKEYVIDYEKDYFSGKDIFIAERPIVYYRHGENKKNYEVFGRDVFDIKLSDIGYSSIHYIINVNGTYIELQVRTIYDEAWSECDHDFVYKLNASPKKLVLKRCSKMLSDITGVADSLSTFIRDYYSDKILEEDFLENADFENSDFKDNKGQNRNNYKRVSIDIDKVSDVFDLF